MSFHKLILKTSIILFIYVGSVKQTRKTTKNQGDSLELLSLSLVLDVRHSVKAEGEGVADNLKNSRGTVIFK